MLFGKYKVLKNPTNFVEVEVIEKIAPRELKLILALDFCKKRLGVHVIEEKGTKERGHADNMKIPKFNSLDKIENFFFFYV